MILTASEDAARSYSTGDLLKMLEGISPRFHVTCFSGMVTGRNLLERCKNSPFPHLSSAFDHLKATPRQHPITWCIGCKEANIHDLKTALGRSSATEN